MHRECLLMTHIMPVRHYLVAPPFASITTRIWRGIDSHRVPSNQPYFLCHLLPTITYHPSFLSHLPSFSFLSLPSLPPSYSFLNDFPPSLTPSSSFLRLLPSVFLLSSPLHPFSNPRFLPFLENEFLSPALLK